MDRSEVITLVAYTRTQDQYGVWRDNVPTETRVFCQVDSVTRSEFFEAGQNGITPEYRFTMFFGDYSGQGIVIYKGETYSVYRTFHARTDMIELYVERKTGV